MPDQTMTQRKRQDRFNKSAIKNMVIMVGSTWKSDHFFPPPVLPVITTLQTQTSTGSCVTPAPWSPSTWSSPTCCRGSGCRRFCPWTTVWRRWVTAHACRRSIRSKTKNIGFCLSVCLSCTTCWWRRASWTTPTSSTRQITATTSGSLASSKVGDLTQ